MARIRGTKLGALALGAGHQHFPAVASAKTSATPVALINPPRSASSLGDGGVASATARPLAVAADVAQFSAADQRQVSYLYFAYTQRNASPTAILLFP